MLKLQKTPISNSSTILQRVEGINDDLLTTLLPSHLLGEGVYGFEIIGEDNDTEKFLITPALFREDLGVESFRECFYLQSSLSQLECFQIFLNKPSFLPLYTEKTFSLLNHLSLLHSDNFYIQFLFTQLREGWEEEAIIKYDEYKKGNDFPSNSKMGRMVQNAMLKVVSKVGQLSLGRKDIPEIEQKILDYGYRFEIRMIVHGEIGNFEDELNLVLKEVDLFNELRFMKIKTRHKKEFVEQFLNRQFSPFSNDQFISERELICLTSEDDMTIPKQDTSVVEIGEKAKKEVTSSVVNISLINLLPIGEKKDRKIDENIVSQIPNALKKARTTKSNDIEILEVELGATVQRVTFRIPNDTVYSEIKNKYEDIKSSLATDLSIVNGKESDTVTFLIPCKEREVIYLVELLQDKRFMEFAKNHPLSFPCGIDVYGDLVMKSLAEAPHLLIAGGTGSGKSVFFNILLMSLILLNNSDELEIHLIDPKKVEFGMYEGFPQVKNTCLDMNRAEDILDSLIKEMDERYEEFSKKRVRNISSYNEKSKKKLPYIVCMIDEYNDLKMLYPQVEMKLERLTQKARGAGIHLIIATQRPDKDVMTGVIRANLPSIICFKLINQNHYKTAFGTGIPYKNLLGKGDGVVKYDGQTEEFIRFQSPIISLSSQEEDKIIDNIKKVLKGEKVDRKQEAVEEVAEENPIDKLKEIILSKNETRVKELQKEMNMGMNKVHELMKQLLDEGFLVKNENNRYEVNRGQYKEEINPVDASEMSDEELYELAKKLVISKQEVSAKLLQQYFNVGFTRATIVIDMLEEKGVIGKYNGSEPREVLMKGND